MKIIRWEELDSGESALFFSSVIESGQLGTSVTIGGFDGPHRGHEALFSAVLSNAASKNLVPGIITFTRSPGNKKKPLEYPGDVSTLHLRLQRFAQIGFDFVLLIDFSGEFGKMTGGVFFDILVKTVRMRYLAVGPDFRCGHRLDTGTAEIAAISRKDGFCFDSIEQVELDGLRISSSAVRSAVQTADFSRAERLLGHPFLLDFTSPVWRPVKDGLEADIRSFTQILPRRGSYRVVLDLVDGTSSSAILDIAGKTVCVHPDGLKALPEPGSISTVQFRLS